LIELRLNGLNLISFDGGQIDSLAASPTPYRARWPMR